MLRKHFVVIGIRLALVFLIVSTFFYPGGSQYDETAAGFHWQHNYLSNLVNEKAVNGINNTARPWAVLGVFFLTAAVAVFFMRFYKKYPIWGRRKSSGTQEAGRWFLLFSRLHLFTTRPAHYRAHF